MAALLTILLQAAPWVIWILSLIGGINTWNSATAVVVYGSTPDQSSILASILPLLFAGLGQFGVSWARKYIDSLTGVPVVGAAAEIMSILAIREIAGTDPERQKTVNTLAHQWVDKEFPLAVVATEPARKSQWVETA